MFCATVKLLAVSSMMYMYGSESDTFTSQTMSGVTIFTINSNFDVTRYTKTMQITNTIAVDNINSYTLV